ncbi:MAG: methylenetetrahydrofolate--tRNA-(uracil(54)-C(5))-methyltransferase (FADH(2)-oxidizing) TrmFO [Evtepia sp.]
MSQRVIVVGAGLAGSEAAWQLAKRGIAVTLCEMKPKKRSPAHHTDEFAELVCSNSLRSDQLENAVGLLKEELRRCGSLIMACADATQVAAGGALAVDREAFSKAVTSAIRTHPNIEVETREVTTIPEDGDVVIATGPLTSDALADAIGARFQTQEYLHFYDAAAPLVAFESIDLESAWFASRYDKGSADYINCPLSREEYACFWKELIHAEEAEVHGFEDKKVFDGCMPIEVMARRGEKTLCYGPLKPRGLRDPKTGKEPFAVVQLRRDNAEGSLYNLVGFQTHLKFPEQRRVFSMIPALKNAVYLRYGVMHRNTYLNAPQLLDRYYRVRTEPRLVFAGQITGVEGYVESTASGFLAGFALARRLLGEAPLDFPQETAIGALAIYVSQSIASNFQPMNINFGIMPSMDEPIKGKRNKNAALSARALACLESLSIETREEDNS